MLNFKIIFRKIAQTVECAKSFIKESIKPLIFSLISASIFYIFVHYIPNIEKAETLNRKVTNDTYKICKDMFYIFDQIMSHNSHSPSNFQVQIRNGLLEDENLIVGLHSKVLNNKHLRLLKGEFKSSSLIVGDDIYKRKKKILDTIEQLYPFVSYISEKQFLILEKIKKLVKNNRDPDRNPCRAINKQELCAVNPTMNSQKYNFMRMYDNYVELKKILLLERESHTNSIIREKVEWMYYNKEYRKLLDNLSSYKRDYSLEPLFVKKYEYLSLKKLGEAKKSLRAFKDFLKKFSQSPIGWRQFFMKIDRNSQEWTILREKFTKQELSHMIRIYQYERTQEKAFIRRGREIKAYYENL